MDNKNDKLKNKYNFDISSEFTKNEQTYLKTPLLKKYCKFIFIQQINKKNNKKNLKPIVTKNDNLDYKIVIENKEELNKIKIESKSYHQNLKRKVKLNYNLVRLFIDNFYSNDFNYTRKSTYLLFGLPLSVLLSFVFFYPGHPLIQLVLGSCVLSTSMCFIYYFNYELNNLAKNENSNIGMKLKMIKNELVLYNPLSNPVEANEDDINIVNNNIKKDLKTKS